MDDPERSEGPAVDPAFFEPLRLAGRHLCDVMIDAAPRGPGRVGSPFGPRMIAYIDDGRFEGAQLRGRVMPGGGDWPTLAHDTPAMSMRIDVRAVWETHDGARLYVEYNGFVVMPEDPGAMARLPELDPSAYYFRTAPTFQTDDPRYAWLNTTLCVGIGRFAPGGLGYRIFALD